MTNTPDNEFEDEAELNAEAGLDAHPADDDLAPVDALIAERDQWKDRALRAVAEAVVLFGVIALRFADIGGEFLGGRGVVVNVAQVSCPSRIRPSTRAV